MFSFCDTHTLKPSRRTDLILDPISRFWLHVCYLQSKLLVTRIAHISRTKLVLVLVLVEQYN